MHPRFVLRSENLPCGPDVVSRWSKLIEQTSGNPVGGVLDEEQLSIIIELKINDHSCVFVLKTCPNSYGNCL